MCETMKTKYSCEHHEEIDNPCERAKAAESSNKSTPCTERYGPNHYTPSEMLCNTCHSAWFANSYSEGWEKKWKPWLDGSKWNANLHSQIKLLKESYNNRIEGDLARWEAENVSFAIYASYSATLDELWTAAQPKLNMFWDAADQSHPPPAENTSS